MIIDHQPRPALPTIVGNVRVTLRPPVHVDERGFITRAGQHEIYRSAHQLPPGAWFLLDLGPCIHPDWHACEILRDQLGGSRINLTCSTASSLADWLATFHQVCTGEGPNYG